MQTYVGYYYLTESVYVKVTASIFTQYCAFNRYYCRTVFLNVMCKTVLRHCNSKCLMLVNRSNDRYSYLVLGQL